MSSVGRQMIRDEVSLKLAILDNVTYDSRPEDLEALLHLFRGTQVSKGACYEQTLVLACLSW